MNLVFLAILELLAKTASPANRAMFPAPLDPLDPLGLQGTMAAQEKTASPEQLATLAKMDLLAHQATQVLT